MITADHRWLASALVIAAGLWRVPPSMGQEKTHSPFSCVEPAVTLDIRRDSPLRFDRLAAKPAQLTSFNAHEFRFKRAPFEMIRVYLAATLPEETIARDSRAVLTIFAETAPSPANALDGPSSQWWQLTGLKSDNDKATENLTFDARRVANCFGASRETDCAFADVAQAAPEPDVPLIAVGFTLDLDGANAQNRTEARLLLDFRASPPRVAVTAECDYNEGGGACTAIDSSMTPRSSFTCDWAADAADFLCTERSSAHRDFYLLSDRRPPRRPGELESVEDAARRLATGRIGDVVVVRGLGRMQLIADVKMPSNRDALIFRAPREFLLVRRSSGEFAPALRVVPHLPTPPLSLENADADEPEGTSSEWTSDVTQLVTSRELFRDSTLVVLQIVEVDGSGSPAALYWVGIDFSQPRIMFDAVQLVDGGVYDHCGEEKVPATVTSVGKITRPFRASVVFRPPTIRNINSDDQAGEWDAGEGGDSDSIVECARGGTIFWKQGHFVGAMDPARCRTPEKPRAVVVLPDGRLRVENPRRPES